MQIAAQSLEFYSEDEPRDSHGRWTYTYEVQYAEDHEAMAKAQYKTTHVRVQADSEPEANLIAAQMGGRHGIPTATKLIGKTLTAAGALQFEYEEDQHPRAADGRWATEGGDKDLLAREVKALQAELTAQGVPEDAPIRGVVDHRGYKLAVSRDSAGKINGALAYTRDRGDVHLVDFRAMEEGNGIGSALMQHAAQGAKSMTVTSAVGSAVPFYQSQGGEFYAFATSNVHPEHWRPTAEDLTWSSHGSWDKEATEAVAAGHPIDKRIPLEEGYANHQRAGGNSDYMTAAGPLEFDYNPDESRDQGGKWTSGAGGGAAAEKASIAQDRSFSPPGAHPWPLVPGQQQGTWAVGGAGYGGGPRKKLVCSPSTSPGGSGEPLPGRAQQPATSCVTDAQAQLILSTAADLQALYPLSPPLSIGVVSPEQATIDSGAGAMAYTDMAENHISIIVGTPATTNIHSDATNGLGERYATVDPIRYIIAHEYGHAQQPDSGLVTAIHDKVLALPQSGGLSGYGQGSAVEGYAEAFADYVCSGGKPTSDATRIYADTFGWKR